MTALASSIPLVPAARFSPYLPLPEWPSAQPRARIVFAHACAETATFADHLSGGAQCLARTRLCAATIASASTVVPRARASDDGNAHAKTETTRQARAFIRLLHR